MLKSISQTVRGLSLAALLALTPASGLLAAEPAPAENPQAQQLQRIQQVYMYLDFLDLLLDLSERYEAVCNHNPCGPEALASIRDEVSKRHPAGALLLVTEPELTAHELKNILGEADFKRLNDALRRYAQSVKQIRNTSLADLAPLQAVWKESLGEQDPQRRAVQSSVKSNMHSLQVMLETYAVDWGGVYPESLGALYAEAIVEGREYWKELYNPYTQETGIGASILDYPAYRPMPWAGGMAIYEPVVEAGSPVVKYFIYGSDKNGQLVQDKGRDIFLSNS